VIRFMTIRVDDHEKGPSAMMRRSDRDRGPREGGREGRDGGRGGDRGGFRREEEAE
jgi:small subunit ribosomal protein S6